MAAPTAPTSYSGYVVGSASSGAVRLYPVGAFIGLAITAGHALGDPGARDGCVGQTTFVKWLKELAKWGLRARVTEAPASRTCGGVGGGARVLSVAEIPVGIAKVPGLVRMTVIEDAVGHEVPALFPVNLISGLKCVLDFDDSTMLMKAFDRTAPMQKLPTGHFEVSMIDFPDGGWKVPDDLQGEYPPDAFMLPEGPPPGGSAVAPEPAQATSGKGHHAQRAEQRAARARCRLHRIAAANRGDVLRRHTSGD